VYDINGNIVKSNDIIEVDTTYYSYDPTAFKFYVYGLETQAKVGWTWGDWLTYSAEVFGDYVAGDYTATADGHVECTLVYALVMDSEGNHVSVSDQIIANHHYEVDELRLIEFYIDNITYYAEEGMTWEQWVDSKYNDGTYCVARNEIRNESDNPVLYEGSYDLVHRTDEIESNGTYIC
jgi:hypothetical protein